jgi:hypothetical protein
MARGHETDFVKTGKFPFGCDGITGFELAGFDDTANRALDTAVRGNTVIFALREHSLRVLDLKNKPHAYTRFGTNRDESIAKWSGEPADHRREISGFSRAVKIPNNRTIVNSLLPALDKGYAWPRAAKAAKARSDIEHL